MTPGTITLLIHPLNALLPPLPRINLDPWIKHPIDALPPQCSPASPLGSNLHPWHKHPVDAACSLTFTHFSPASMLSASSIRSNLDPWNKHPDSALWEVLSAVKLNKAVGAAGGLHTRMQVRTGLPCQFGMQVSTGGRQGTGQGMSKGRGR